jgi:hypothetical protein
MMRRQANGPRRLDKKRIRVYAFFLVRCGDLAGSGDLPFPQMSGFAPGDAVGDAIREPATPWVSGSEEFVPD